MPESRREYLLLDEVARECRAPIASVRYWIASGRLRSVRPGRRRLVSREELDRFLGASTATSATGRVVEGQP
jgi:excisionase family DNA binding protein